jgi:hypothetical protein
MNLLLALKLASVVMGLVQAAESLIKGRSMGASKKEVVMSGVGGVVDVLAAKGVIKADEAVDAKAEISNLIDNSVAMAGDLPQKSGVVPGS